MSFFDISLKSPEEWANIFASTGSPEIVEKFTIRFKAAAVEFGFRIDNYKLTLLPE